MATKKYSDYSKVSFDYNTKDNTIMLRITEKVPFSPMRYEMNIDIYTDEIVSPFSDMTSKEYINLLYSNLQKIDYEHLIKYITFYMDEPAQFESAMDISDFLIMCFEISGSDTESLIDDLITLLQEDYFEE